LLVADDLKESFDLNGIPFIFHLEMPIEMESFIGRIVKNTYSENSDALAISFATDLELSIIKKIEQAIGLPIPLAELPEDLVIEKDKPKKAVKTEVQETESGSAFHAKKQSNIKDYNYSSREKAKMKFKNR
jgi:ATP-dependent RNA helicase RhlE